MSTPHTIARKHPLWLRLAPVLLGLAGCVLPMQTFKVQQQYYHTMAWQNYSGWGVLVLLLLYAAYSLVQRRRQQATHRFADTLVGAYLAGWALFNAYHTLALFGGGTLPNLAHTLQAAAWPREGLLLLLLAGIWMVAGAVRKGS